MAWTAIGIILAVIAPIMLCIVCGVYCYRKKALKDDPNWQMPLPRSRSGSRATLRRLNSDSSETDQDTLKKSRSYDKVYRTNEPLEGKPMIDFPEKKWDLDEEDVTSSEGSEFKDSKVARDIEYINKTGEKPRQTGRHSLKPEATIAEEDQSFPPPPTGDDASISQYSPTFSAADRNSGNSGTSTLPNTQPLHTTGGVRVLPTVNNGMFRPSQPSPASPTSSLTQEIGLPRLQSTRSTEV